MFSDYYAFARFTSRLESLNVTIHDLKVRPYNDTRTPPVHLIKFTITPTDDAAPISSGRLHVLASQIRQKNKCNPFQQYAAPNPVEHREFPRTGAAWSGKLETAGETLHCTVLNLSANDAKIVLSEPVTANCWSGVLSMPSLGAFKEKVAWSTPKGSNEIGLTFEDPSAAVALVLAETLPRNRAKWID